jgi:uncharacterized membrane protein (Fun14 family)
MLMNGPIQDPSCSSQAAAPSRRPFWQLTSLRLAAAMTLVGALLWVRALYSGAVPVASSVKPSTQARALEEPSTARGGARPSAGARAPALFRLGVSYLGGFFLGWLCRKSLKLAMLAGGAAVALLALARHTGLIDLDWAGVQAHVSQSLAWTKGEIGAVRHFLTGYLPSSAAAVVGLFMGARHR